MRPIITFFKSYFLQSLLAIVALFSWVESQELGHRFMSESGTYQKELPMNEYETVGTSVSITSGFTGGALAMGLISCVCIVMIVWIEIKKEKLI
jgi:hypothetical protein